LIRTLHAYLARELAKVTGLALMAFTLVMTVFAIMEPLRKRGLATDQVVELFGYMLPVMLSFTLPVAALFATTIVYGRFAFENELLACRASGVSTLTLLKPALGLAALVTVCSLVLSNFVSPAMASRADQAVQANIRGYAYNQLRTRQHIEGGPSRSEQYIIHADRVDPETDELKGVVAIQAKSRSRKPGDVDVRWITARSAKLKFFTSLGESYVAFDLIDFAPSQSSTFYTGQAYHQPIPPIKIPNPLKEKPSWYDWGQLLRTIRNPALNSGVSRRLTQVRHQIAADMLANEVADAIGGNDATGFCTLRGVGRTYVVQAGEATPKVNGVVMLSARGEREVSVTHFADDVEAAAWRAQPAMALFAGPQSGVYAGGVFLTSALPRVATAALGRLEVRYDSRTDQSLVSLILDRDVVLRAPALGGLPSRRDEWSIRLPLPEHIAARMQDLQLDNIYDQAERFRTPTAGPIFQSIDHLKRVIVPDLVADLIAEMHVRISYGSSCFLLVALGAAMGLIFRGGHVVSAFAISVIPAAAVIVMILMGKEMARNPDVPMTLGLGIIWAGVTGLLVVTAGVYAYLARR